MKRFFEVLLVISGLVLVVAFGILMLIGLTSTAGPADYLERAGYEVTDISTGGISIRCTSYSGNRMTRMSFSFTGKRDGVPVKGYICYGGMVEAKIHTE